MLYKPCWVDVRRNENIHLKAFLKILETTFGEDCTCVPGNLPVSPIMTSPPSRGNMTVNFSHKEFSCSVASRRGYFKGGI